MILPYLKQENFLCVRYFLQPDSDEEESFQENFTAQTQVNIEVVSTQDTVRIWFEEIWERFGKTLA